MNPRARDDVPHEAFAATAGGPLEVVSRQRVESHSDIESDSIMLVEPRFEIELSIDSRDIKLHAGQTGELSIRARDQTLGNYVAENIVRVVQARLSRSHGL